MWDLSYPTRDRTHTPLQWKRGVLTAGPPGKSLINYFKHIPSQNSPKTSCLSYSHGLERKPLRQSQGTVFQGPKKKVKECQMPFISTGNIHLAFVGIEYANPGVTCHL